MTTEQTYKNVAEHCSAYSEREKCACQNKAGDTEVSCLTCRHFNDSHHCELDLLDPIVENHNFK
mgnify:CR=1 FL=1